MKRPIFTFCRLALSVLPVLFLLPVQAQDVEDAFYIYRNDGGFHAFSAKMLTVSLIPTTMQTAYTTMMW